MTKTTAILSAVSLCALTMASAGRTAPSSASVSLTSSVVTDTSSTPSATFIDGETGGAFGNFLLAAAGPKTEVITPLYLPTRTFAVPAGGLVPLTAIQASGPDGSAASVSDEQHLVFPSASTAQLVTALKSTSVEGGAPVMGGAGHQGYWSVFAGDTGTPASIGSMGVGDGNSATLSIGPPAGDPRDVYGSSAMVSVINSGAIPVAGVGGLNPGGVFSLSGYNFSLALESHKAGATGSGFINWTAGGPLQFSTTDKGGVEFYVNNYVGNDISTSILEVQVNNGVVQSTVENGIFSGVTLPAVGTIGSFIVSNLPNIVSEWNLTNTLATLDPFNTPVFYATVAQGSTSVADVPEPASWLLLLAGFSGVGASLRRRPTRATSMAG